MSRDFPTMAGQFKVVVLQVNDAVPNRFDGRLGAISHFEFLNERLRMGFDTFLPDAEFLRDLLVAAAVDDEAQDSEFAGR
jgi:hypothetical protein